MLKRLTKPSVCRESILLGSALSATRCGWLARARRKPRGQEPWLSERTVGNWVKPDASRGLREAVGKAVTAEQMVIARLNAEGRAEREVGRP
jgi:hypothetical protein